DLVQSRGLDQGLARGLDVQILVHIVGALDVGVRDPLVLVVGLAASGVGVLERFVRPGLELAFGLVGRGYFGHGSSSPCWLGLNFVTACTWLRVAGYAVGFVANDFES